MKNVYESRMDDWCDASGQLLGYGAHEQPGQSRACDLCGKKVKVAARFGDYGYPAYPRHKPPAAGLTVNDQRFLSLWPQAGSPWLTLEAASEAVGVSKITASAALSRLRKKGLVQRMGDKRREGGAVTYRWTTTETGDAMQVSATQNIKENT